MEDQKEGRAVTKYLAENGLKAKTTKHKKVDSIELTQEQKNIIEQRVDAGWSSWQIAKDLFGDQVKNLTEQRTVHEYLLTLDVVVPAEEAPTYVAPGTLFLELLKKLTIQLGMV